jgi:hypothetical protein
MINPFRVAGGALRDLFDEFLLLIICNLIWAVLCAPLWVLAFGLLLAGEGVFAVAAALVGVLPAGPATAGLYAVAARVTDGRASKVGDFFAGMRAYAGPAIAVTLAAVAGLGLILFNLSFYLAVNNIFGGLMLGLWLYLLIAWLGVIVYAYPLIFLQERPDLRLIARNSALMALGRPLFTVATLLLMGLVTLLSAYLVLPLLIITAALLAIWSTKATRTLIEDARRRREEAEANAVNQGANLSDEKGRKGQVKPK